MKRGFFFSLDSFLASMLLIAALLIITQHINPGTPQQEAMRLSQDALQGLSSIKVKEINNTIVQDWIDDGTIDDPEASIVLQLGKFWAQNLTDEAKQLSDIILKDVLPPGFSVAVELEDDLLYNTTTMNGTQVAAARRMISGVAKGEALTGNTGAAYLKSVSGKTTKSFAYFGGFVGQGKVSTVLENLPADVGPSNIVEATLEGEFDDDFDLYVNSNYCGSFSKSSGDLDVVAYNVTCTDEFVGGDNIIELDFDSLENGSISGGYLRLTYQTSDFNEIYDPVNKTVYMSGIEGVINLYDGLTVPGILTNLSMYLHYEVLDQAAPIFFDIGNTTVYDANSTGEFQIVLDSDYLAGFIDYDDFSQSTVPYRFGYFDGELLEVTGNISDVFLLTSRHFSMGKTDIYVDSFTPNRSRMDQVKIVDELFVNTVLDSPGNRVGLVSFGTGASIDLDSDVTTNNASLQAAIDGYAQHSADAQRNLCGALEEAKAELLNEGGARSRAIMFMTDGDIKKATGQTALCAGGNSNDLDEIWADTVYQACNFADPVHGNPYNITFYAVAFGPEAANDPGIVGNLSKMANCTGGLFATGTNASDLESIYESFAVNISRASVAFDFQRITAVTGVASNLYPDSYFNLTYSPGLPEPGPTQLAITFQTEQFNTCTPTVEILPEVDVYAAVLNSYSGDYWTKEVSIDGTVVYNLSDYGSVYAGLGDPARVLIPASALDGGNHTFNIVIGPNSTVDGGCSNNNSLIYSALINTTVSRGPVLPSAEGCIWTIEFEDGANTTVKVPPTYSGTQTCSYTSANYTLTDNAYDPLDSYDEVVHRLLDNLDFDDDGQIFVNLDASDLEVVATVVSDVPYLWGPSTARVVVAR